MQELIRPTHRKVAIKYCKNYDSVSDNNYKLQTSNPVLDRGSEVEQWFKPFVGRFMLLSGWVIDKNVFNKKELDNRTRKQELITLTTVRLSLAEVEPYEPLGLQLMNQYPPLREQLKILTSNNCSLENTTLLQVLPLIRKDAIHIAHDSVTVAVNELHHRMFQRLLAVLQVHDWNEAIIKPLIKEFAFIGSQVFDFSIFVLQGRRKMARTQNTWESTTALKEHQQLIDRMLSAFEDGGVPAFTKLIFEMQDERLPTKTGEEFIHRLQDDIELLGRLLSSGPFLLDSTESPLWDA